jgi:hypothetical protein
MSLRINSDFNGVTDPDAGRYIAAVEAADGQLLEFGVGKAINDFVVGCKQDRIWDAIKASCILAGARTLSGALVPLAGTAPTNFNFVSGDYNRKTGLVGDGSSKYLNSNRNNNADPQNNKHMAVHGTVSVAGGSYKQLIGTPYSGAGWSALILDNRSPAGFQPWINGANFPSGLVPLTATSGFIGASRSSLTSVTGRIGSANYLSNVNADTPANSNILVFGVVNEYTNARLAFYSIGESLDLALLDARVTALITAFGVAIP